MSLVSGLAVFFIMWWLVLFMVLPWGVRTAEESGDEVVPGHAPSAPQLPRLKQKLIWTTLVTAVCFGLFWLNDATGWVTLADLPGPFRDHVPRDR